MSIDEFLNSEVSILTDSIHVDNQIQLTVIILVVDGNCPIVGHRGGANNRHIFGSNVSGTIYADGVGLLQLGAHIHGSGVVVAVADNQMP